MLSLRSEVNEYIVSMYSFFLGKVARVQGANPGDRAHWRRRGKDWGTCHLGVLKSASAGMGAKESMDVARCCWESPFVATRCRSSHGEGTPHSRHLHRGQNLIYRKKRKHLQNGDSIEKKIRKFELRLRNTFKSRRFTRSS